MTQHSGLSAQRWARFSLAQQVLQIAVEMQRALRFLRAERLFELRCCYERTLALVDLTVEVQSNRGLRRELLRWRGVVAELYLRNEPDPRTHRQALRVLLGLHPEAAKQIAILGL